MPRLKQPGSFGPRSEGTAILPQTALDFSTSRVTFHDFVRDSGRHSAISTRSPSLNSLVSTCAWYFFERVMIFPIIGSRPRRSTWTVTVFCILSLTPRAQAPLLELVGLDVRVVLLRARDDLPHHRVAHPALHLDGNGLLHLVAHHPADELALVLDGGRCRFGAHFAAFSFMMVRTRAMSRFTFLSWLVLASCCVATCMRRPNWARSSPSSSFCRSSPLFSLSSLGFIGSMPQHAQRDDGAERQLRRGERERFLGERLRDAVHLEDDLARLDLGHEVLGVALAVPQAHLGRIGRDRLVGEHADPDAAAALDVARHRAAGSFQLPRGQTPARRRLQAVFAEGDPRAARGDAGVAAFLLLAVFRSCWLEHGNSVSIPCFLPCFRRRPLPCRRRPSWASCPWSWAVRPSCRRPGADAAGRPAWRPPSAPASWRAWARP